MMKAGRPKKYVSEVLRILDTNDFITLNKNNRYETIAKTARSLGFYPVKIFKFLYVRSKPKQREKILSTLM